MAQRNEEVYFPAKGYINTAPRGTAAPTDLGSLPAPWESIGHTSRDDLPQFSSDGGDVEVKGSWQNASLRSVTTEQSIEYVTFNALQWNRTTLSYYYGQEPVNGDSGVFEVTEGAGDGVERALLIVIEDSQNGRVALHAARASLKREDNSELDPEEFAALPIRGTFLRQDTFPLFSWIIPGLGTS